ncbi:MAG: PAS-domain containing protein [Prolixibacteraceae bacterium]|nr:PAS-domain containing protein [Prolixibacteraceae bacterium]MBN2648284.1 PAS-domain containing protein [Prolixibacteraceae bacterium]
MQNTNKEHITDIEALQQKYYELESKCSDEISRLKKNEAELRLRLMFFEGIANSTFDGFLVVDPNGQKILQTQRTIDLWKIPQEVVDDPSGHRQVAHIMHMNTDPQKFISEIQYHMEHIYEKRQYDLELIDGTILEIFSSPVFGADGTHYGRIYTFHDITKRKKYEKQLTQLNSDKDRFISILAHDLRSPFNSLLGLSNYLTKNVSKLSLKEIETIAASIYDTSDKTFSLLEDTLLWASVQSETITYTPVSTNIVAIINEVIEILEPIAQYKNILLKNELENELNANIDIYMFKAILRNLISNAIKFTNKNGEIKISATHINTNTVVKVADNGIGMKQELIDKLFSFEPVNSASGTANETGTGLGLILCKDFVDKHCGKIWVESTLGKGTTVSFSIPDPS